MAGLIALAGCGGSDDSSDANGSGGDGQAGAGPSLDAPLRLANCTDWNDGTDEERRGTAADLAEFAGGPVGGIDARGATLTEEQALSLFETACEPDYARAFELYKLYTRAAGFAGQ